jgi:putative transposase
MIAVRGGSHGKTQQATIDDELIDKLLEGREQSAALRGNDGLIGELKKRLAERSLSAEMDVHLDDEEQQAGGNHRNGYSQKSVTMADDRVVLNIPRDRNGQFDPLLIPKYARRFPGFDDKIIALYARLVCAASGEATVAAGLGSGRC